MLASRLHWRLLIGTILVLMAAAWIAPRFVPPPELRENRVLATAPAWPKHWRDPRARSGRRADAYVADRFQAAAVSDRRALNRLRMLAGVSGSERVLVGRDGWLFTDDGTHMGATRGDPPMTGQETRDWLLTLAARTESLRARGAPYLVLSPPVKEAVYPHGMRPAWFHGAPAPERATIVLPRLARESGAGEVLYLQPPLAALFGRGGRPAARHDTHWTGSGAYISYAALMNRLHGLGLAEAPRPRSDFEPRPAGPHGPRDLASMLGVTSFVDLDAPHLVNRSGSPTR